MAFNQYQYQNEYNKEKYDRVNITFPKGKKELIEKHWKKKGYKSLNTYINELINKDMDLNTEKHPESIGGVQLHWRWKINEISYI